MLPWYKVSNSPAYEINFFHALHTNDQSPTLLPAEKPRRSMTPIPKEMSRTLAGRWRSKFYNLNFNLRDLNFVQLLSPQVYWAIALLLKSQSSPHWMLGIKRRCGRWKRSKSRRLQRYLRCAPRRVNRDREGYESVKSGSESVASWRYLTIYTVPWGQSFWWFAWLY